MRELFNKQRARWLKWGLVDRRTATVSAARVTGKLEGLTAARLGTID